MARARFTVPRHQRHRRIRKATKGYYGPNHRMIKVAMEAIRRALQYARRDRKALKRDMRRLWITRISAACRIRNMNYSQLIHRLSQANIEINRKMLSELAIADAAAFDALVAQVKG